MLLKAVGTVIIAIGAVILFIGPDDLIELIPGFLIFNTVFGYDIPVAILYGWILSKIISVILLVVGGAMVYLL